MVIERGAVHWAHLGPPRGSGPAKRRPVVVVQDDRFNTSALQTVVSAIVTSNLRLAAMPGNVYLPAAATGLPQDSVVNVTGLIAVDRAHIGRRVGQLDAVTMEEVDRGLRRVLGL